MKIIISFLCILLGIISFISSSSGDSPSVQNSNAPNNNLKKSIEVKELHVPKQPIKRSYIIEHFLNSKNEGSSAMEFEEWNTTNQDILGESSLGQIKEDKSLQSIESKL